MSKAEYHQLEQGFSDTGQSISLKTARELMESYHQSELQKLIKTDNDIYHICTKIHPPNSTQFIHRECGMKAYRDFLKSHINKEG